MKTPTTFQLDGETYTVSPYMTSTGMKLLTELVLILGKPLVQLIIRVKEAAAGGSLKDLLEQDVDPATVDAVMTALYERLSPEAVDSLIKRILDQTFVGSTSTKVTEGFDTRFQGKYLHVFKLVFKTLGVQYGDFLGVLGGHAGGKEGKVK